MMRWFDAQGGHLETKGLSTSGDVITVPLHRHHVVLNIFRVDVGLKYHLDARWSLETNIAYESKVQEATVEEIEPVTAVQREAILRNRDIHHRNETYAGYADADLFIGYRTRSLFKENDLLMGRFGTTLPFGQTEEDPWKLGAAGREHLHLQFGTGTFNPIADLHYSLPLYGGFGASASLRGKFPFYENSKTYRGVREVTYTAGLHYRLKEWVTFRASYFGAYQGYAYWAGERDINTGLRFSMLSFGATIATFYDIPISLTVTLPLQQETLYTGGTASEAEAYVEQDAFEFGPLVSVTLLYAF